LDFFPVFLSIVVVTRNRSTHLELTLREICEAVRPLVSDYELIVVDNGSDDDSIATLRRLTAPSSLPNVQVYALTKQVDADTGTWVGLENGLGDFFVALDPEVDDLAFLPSMLDKALSGADVVFARNVQASRQSFAYRLLSDSFHYLYGRLTGINLAREAPQYRVLSRRVVNFILQHLQPSVSYRHLPATSGFSRCNLDYKAQPRVYRRKSLNDAMDRGMRLLVSTTRAPMRVVTSLSLFGAVANVIYSIYVVIIAVFKEDVAPGWVSLSLQQSGMFLLLSLVLLVLGEYILQMASLSNGGPQYHVAQEFTSAQMTRRERLNVEGARADEAQQSALI